MLQFNLVLLDHCWYAEGFFRKLLFIGTPVYH